MHEEKKNKHEEEGPVAPGAIPAYLMDRKNQSSAKVYFICSIILIFILGSQQQS
jgi:hypothetical protein